MQSISLAQLGRLSPDGVQLPPEALFHLPEKVLQFGTGVLLRGLPDYFIDQANRQGIFNGRIVVVKSTDLGDSDAFSRQDNLYTVCIRGIEGEKTIDETVVCASISRVLSAKNQWPEVMACAHNSELRVVVSNTTEAGIQLVQDSIQYNPPVSFPGKLLSFLYERFSAFGGSPKSGLVIVPTELLPDNGRKLEAIVLELAHRHGLEASFLDWLETHNFFCSSLVDRIVPGVPIALAKQEAEEKLGYRDDLLTVAETYGLWAIEGDAHIRSVLSFYQANEGVWIEPSIDLHRELKLRLLNGTHTLSCGLAFLCGFTTVKEAMQDEYASAFISHLILDELAPAIPFALDAEVARRFGHRTLDRFRNPHIDHYWLNITMQYTAKMRLRNIPTLLRYYRDFQAVPHYLSLGMAAYFRFMKTIRKEGEKYWGEVNGQAYLIQDEQAAYYDQKWATMDTESLVRSSLGDGSLWGEDLSLLPGLTEAVAGYLDQILQNGALETLRIFLRHNPSPMQEAVARMDDTPR
jgi:tagaturonate reductase